MAGRDDDSTTAIDADDNTRANGRTSGKPSQFILLLERELGVPVLPDTRRVVVITNVGRDAADVECATDACA